MWYLIFVLTFASGDHVEYLDAGGNGKIYTDKTQCETDGKGWLKVVASQRTDAQGVWAACIKLPGTTT
jgi:hypothetical protein